MKQEEFKLLFDRYFDSLRSYIYYRCGDKDLATDVAQEAFIKLWEKQETYEPKRNVGLLYKMASNLFVSRYRHQKVVDGYASSFSFVAESESPEEELLHTELQDSYEKALNDLPEKQRTVFLMSRMEELKYEEIAQRLDISVKAVEKRMHNALLYLRKVLL
ncbi:MAG: hypothetical protein RIS47_164 [Bacteroidota bacterium]